MLASASWHYRLLTQARYAVSDCQDHSLPISARPWPVVVRVLVLWLYGRCGGGYACLEVTKKPEHHEQQGEREEA